MRTSLVLVAIIFIGLSMTIVGDAQGLKRTEYSNWSVPSNIGPPINTQWDDNVPVLSNDENTLYFTSNRPGSVDNSEDIWVAHRQNKNARWEEPVNLGYRINSPYMERMRSISADGRIILFQSDRPTGYGGTDIWAITRKRPNDDFGWSRPVNLGPVINSASNELAAKYLFDERHQKGDLFFSSNRPGGFGGPDIYESEIMDTGFASPLNVSALNTPSFEVCFWVRDDGLEIVFTSNRPDLTGDTTKYDLWSATRSSVYDDWSTPVNLGPAVNSEGYVDANPMLASGDRALYFASARPNEHGPVGNMDIYFSERKKLR